MRVSVLPPDYHYTGPIIVSRLPGTEGLKESGVREGQTKIVCDNDEVICYSWSVEGNTWNKLGNVAASTPILFKTTSDLSVSEKELFYSVQHTF